MGTYLGTDKEDKNELGCSSCGLNDGLGIPGIDPVTLLSTAGSLVSPIRKLFGGRSKCSSSDKQRRQEIANAIREYLTPQDMRNLVSGMTDRVAPNPEAMAYFYLGEDDCLHKNVAPRHQRFLTELEDLLQQRIEEAEIKKASNNTPVTTINQGSTTPAAAATSAAGFNLNLSKPVMIGGGLALAGGVAWYLLKDRNDAKG